MKEARRANLLQLLNSPRFNGDRSSLCSALGITKGRLSQLLDKNQAFGERAARTIEERLGLPNRLLEKIDLLIEGVTRDAEQRIADDPNHPAPRNHLNELYSAVMTIGRHLQSADDIARNQARPIFDALCNDPKRAPELADRLSETLAIQTKVANG